MKQLFCSKGPNHKNLTLKVCTFNDDKFIHEFICDKLIAYFINDIEVQYYQDDKFVLQIYYENNLIRSYDETSDDFLFSNIRDLINEYINKNI